MHEIIERYLDILKAKGENGEKFKWEAIDNFQKFWNIDALDFNAMFRSAFRIRGPLFFQNSWGFISNSAKHFPEDVRLMFRNLYNENNDLEKRILEFQESAKKILPKLKVALSKTTFNDQQDERTISVYLSFRYPEKYYIYMYSFYSNYCEALKIPIVAENKRYLHYLELANYFRDNYVRGNTTLAEMHKTIFPDTKWNSENVATQNILFLLFLDTVFLKELHSKFSVGIIMVNITWNSNNWKTVSDDPSKHGWVIAGNTPHESWNFDFENPRNSADQVFGYAQFTNPPKVKENNNLIIFHSDGKIVGFYGNAEIIHDPVKVNENESYNLIGRRNLSLVLDNKLDKLKEKGYLEEKERMGQIGFIYLHRKETVLQILKEAIFLNPTQKLQLEQIKTWFSEFHDPLKITINTMENNLNQILFGPPGTGKTFKTVNEALKIADPEFYQINKDKRKQLKKRFRELLITDFEKTTGQIVFCTFHQSFSYEDFVEGIKPLKPKADDKSVLYDIQSGVFKNICRLSQDYDKSKEIQSNPLVSMTENEFNKAIFYKLSLGDIQDENDKEIYEYCIKNNCISIGFGGGVDYTGLKESEITDKCKELQLDTFHAQALNFFIHYMKVGNYVIISKGNKYVRALGKIKGNYKFETTSPIRHKNFREVEWIFKDEDIPVNEIYVRNLSQMTIYKLDEKGILKDFFVKSSKLVLDFEKKEKKFVLIIDEINRGNISSIFGELITLIEKDKRAGANEELEVILPYSKEPFKVPDNVYLIGTMNTADRSIESLDTALRRRFSFVEIAPDPELIKLEGNFAPDGMVDGIDVAKMLETINNRIEKLIDKDHKIGHAYFLHIAKSIEAMELVFKDKIIPLLEEYFFGDFGKIGLVLGSSFVEKVNTNGFEFAQFPAYGEMVSDLKERPVYRIKPNDGWDFKSIYESKV